MLIASPQMTDINVDHWRNLQGLLLEPASGRPRIVVIHKDGEVLKFVHSERRDIVRNIERIDDPREAAEEIYNANSGNVDFVAVFERRAIDRYFAQVQDTWNSDEGVDDYVHRMYATLDEYPDGIVTYPDPASTTLGLQWRVGESYEEVQAAVARFVPPETTVVFGIFEDDALWASLVLGFDADKRVSLITTADTSEMDVSGGLRAVAKNLVEWANKFSPCSLGLFVGFDDAKALLASRDEAATLREMAGKDKLIAEPVPELLTGVLAAS